MPINLYRVTPANEPRERIAWLCDDEWRLSHQVDALSEWLAATAGSLLEGEYVADIGFCWRRNAASGGPVLGVATMRRMVDANVSLFLSEYPGFADDDAADEGAEADESEPGLPSRLATERHCAGGICTMSTEEDFHLEMLSIYDRAGRELSYWAHRYLSAVRRHGGLEWARRTLAPRPDGKAHEGLQRLLDAGRPDLTVEFLVLRPEHQGHFTAAQLDEARKRLSAFSAPQAATR